MADADGTKTPMFSCDQPTTWQESIIVLSPRICRCIVLPWFLACPLLPGTELEPVGPGPFAVGSTNLEVTPRSGMPMFDFLNGKATTKETVYLTDILTHPEAVPTLSIDVPGGAKLFGAQAGSRIPPVRTARSASRRRNLSCRTRRARASGHFSAAEQIGKRRHRPCPDAAQAEWSAGLCFLAAAGR